MLGGEYLTLGTQVELSLIHYAHLMTSAQPLVVIALVLSYEYRQRATAVVLFAYCLQPLSDALAFLLTVTLALLGRCCGQFFDLIGFALCAHLSAAFVRLNAQRLAQFLAACFLTPELSTATDAPALAEHGFALRSEEHTSELQSRPH